MALACKVSSSRNCGAARPIRTRARSDTLRPLASDAADYVVGTTLFVDGGMSLYPDFREGG